MAKAILFVDDEANILLGLKRMLRSLRHEMDFFFAESGAKALAIVADHEIDVIVSDMRMPGMDGGTLLTSVMEQYPQIIRIMLSGQADDKSILQTIPVVHQFMAKPFEPHSLKEILSRACALQNLVASDQLKKLVAGLGNLPSQPAVYAELLEKIMDPGCAVSDIAEIIEKDLAMSVKVLQLINSAHYGRRNRIDSPARAVTQLGLETIKALVQKAGIFTDMAPASAQGFSASALRAHSYTVARFAENIARAESADSAVAGHAFIAGIVHDIGKLLLCSSRGELYLQAVAMAEAQSIPLFQAEHTVFGADHGDLGGYLMGLWGLPWPVVEAAALHNKLEKSPVASFCPALAVHAADVVYYMLKPGQCVGELPSVNRTYLERAGLSGRFEQWVALCKEIQMEEEQND